jgi:hypothetical protein
MMAQWRNGIKAQWCENSTEIIKNILAVGPLGL